MAGPIKTGKGLGKIFLQLEWPGLQDFGGVGSASGTKSKDKRPAFAVRSAQNTFPTFDVHFAHLFQNSI
jgi:hypothetical protein